MTVEQERPQADGQVRLLPTDPRDMVPSAVRWADAVLADMRRVPRSEMYPSARASLAAVAWVLAAAADYENRIPADHTAAVLAAEAGVGARTWQKRTAWLRRRGWLEHGDAGPWTGWVLAAPGWRR